MADFSEWGGGGGVSSAIADQGTMAQTALTQAKVPLTQVETQLKQQELANNPQAMQSAMMKQQADTMNAWASASKHIADAGLANEALRETKALADRMSKMSAGGGSLGADGSMPAMSEIVASWSKMAMQAGAPQKAIDLAKESSTLAGHEQTARKNALDAARAARQAEVTDMDKYERGWRIVETPEDAQQLTQQFRQSHNNSPAPWEPLLMKGLPVSIVRDLMRDQALSYKDKLAEEDRKQRQAALEEDRKIRNNMTGTLRDIQQQQADTAKERAADARKRGEVVSEPNKSEVDAAKGMIKVDFPGIDPSLADRVGLEIAEAAKAARTRNPGIEMRTARNRAYIDAKKRLSTLTTPGGWFSKDTTKITDALPMEMDVAKRVVGQKYEQGDKMYEWTTEGGKQGWKAVQ